MNQKAKLWIGVIIVVVGMVVVGAVAFWQNSMPGELDSFAKCIKDSGAVFYGAFWCPHCQDEKALFGRSAKHLPYVECSTPDSKGQLQLCKDKKIEVYPTWTFANETKEEGELSLRQLAEKTGCTLP